MVYRTADLVAIQPPRKVMSVFGWQKIHQAEIAYFLIFGFVVSTNTTQIKDGGLSFGNFYITRSWEEDYSAPGWILAHHWRDPGRFFRILHQNNTFPGEMFIFHENTLFRAEYRLGSGSYPARIHPTMSRMPLGCLPDPKTLSKNIKTLDFGV